MQSHYKSSNIKCAYLPFEDTNSLSMVYTEPSVAAKYFISTRRFLIYVLLLNFNIGRMSSKWFRKKNCPPLFIMVVKNKP